MIMKLLGLVVVWTELFNCILFICILNIFDVINKKLNGKILNL